MDSVKKYLTTYADKRLWPAQDAELESDYVLVIPSYNEDENFLLHLSHLKNLNQSVLVIVVVNAPINASEDAIKNNQNLMAQFSKLGQAQHIAADLVLYRDGKFKLLSAGPYGLPAHMGVGLARKIGADCALALIAEKRINSDIIFCTDADACLPFDYFARLAERRNFSAAVYPFSHEEAQDSRQEEAIRLYEARMHRYVAGLTHAESPYAFHTIGSTIALKAQHYAEVRGFPLLSAGEDFYILNKLRKLAPVISLSGEPILLSSRVSDRVLFGTGPALAKILKNTDPKDAPIFYDEHVFSALKELLFSAQQQLNNGQTILSFSGQIGQAFSVIDSDKLERTLSSRRTIDDRLRSFHDYFDAFKTLKFLHFLRDNYFPMRSFHALSL